MVDGESAATALNPEGVLVITLVGEGNHDFIIVVDVDEFRLQIGAHESGGGHRGERGVRKK